MDFLPAVALLALVVVSNAAAIEPVVGVEPNSANYYSAQVVFVDAFKQSLPWRSRPKDQELETDERGWVKALKPGQEAWSQVFADIGGRYPGGEYACFYKGRGRLELSGSATVVAREPGRLKVSVKPSEEPIRIALTETVPEDHLRNVRLIPPGFADSHRQQVFHPRFLDLLEGFGVIRFHSLMQHGTGRHEKWADRVKPDHQTQGGRRGVALEYAVDLCNRTEADAWFVMPHRARKEYFGRFAELVRARLDPGLRVYVEYGHDVGVWPTPSSQYCIERGRAEGLSEDWATARMRYYCHRSAEVFRVWEEVFQGDERLVTVLGRVGSDPEQFTYADAAAAADAMGFVSIFGAKWGRPDRAAKTVEWSLEEFMERLQAEVHGPLPEEDRRMMRLAREHGLKVVSFYTAPIIVASQKLREDSPALFRRMQAKALAAQRHPRIEGIYLDHLARWRSAGGGTWINVGLVHKPTRWGWFGLLENVQQRPKDSPKFRAVRAAMRGEALRRAGQVTGKALHQQEGDRPRVIKLMEPDLERRRDPMMGPISPMVARIDFNGYLPERNIRVAFERGDTPEHSVWWTPPYLAGQEKQKFYRVHITRNPFHWQKFRTSFIPAADGAVEVQLKAVATKRYEKAEYDAEGTWRLWCDYDNLSVTGATLRNPDFERVENGLPAGWELFGRYTGVLSELRRGAEEAVSGENYVHVNTGSGFSAALEGVEAGREVALTWWARAHNPEEEFDARVGLNGAVDGEPADLLAEEIPRRAVFWNVDTWRASWGRMDRWNMRKTRKALLLQLDEEWKEFVLRFVPSTDGDLELTLQGVRVADPDRDVLVRRWVDYDALRVEGAELSGGGFEQGQDARPDGWRPVGRDEEVQSMINGGDASEGRSYVRVWYEGGLRTRLQNAQAGRPVVIRFTARRSPGKP